MTASPASTRVVATRPYSSAIRGNVRVVTEVETAQPE